MQRAWVWVCLLLLAVPARGQEGFVAIDLGESALSWLLEPESGRLFAATAEGVLEVSPSTGERVGLWPVPGGARCLLVKQGLLLAASRSERQLVVFALDSGEEQGRIALRGRAWGLGASRAPNLIAFAAVRVGEYEDAAELTQLDLEALRPTAREGIGERVTTLVISSDGSSALADTRGAGITPSGLFLFDLDEARGVFTLREDLHDSFDELGRVEGQGFIAGRQTVSSTLEWGPKYAGAPLALHPSRDLAASLVFVDPHSRRGKPELVLERASDRERLQAFRLEPFPWTENSWSHYEEHGFPSLAFDGARERLLLGWSRRGLVIELEALKLDAGRLLRLVAPGRAVGWVGEALSLPLGINAEGAPRFRVLDGPEGAGVEGDRLVWTPTAEQLGQHVCKLEARLDGERAYGAVRIDVRRRAVLSPVRPGQLVLGPRGRRALIRGWGDAAGNDVIVLDLETGDVLGRLERDPRYGVPGMALGAESAFLASSFGNDDVLLERLHVASGDHTQVRFRGRPEGLLALPDGGVAVSFGRWDPVARFSPDLKPLGPLGAALSNQVAKPLPHRLPEGARVGWTVMDAEGVQLVWGPLVGLPSAGHVRGQPEQGYKDLDAALTGLIEESVGGVFPWGPPGYAGWNDRSFGRLHEKLARAIAPGAPRTVYAWTTAAEVGDEETVRELWTQAKPLPGGTPQVQKLAVIRGPSRDHTPLLLATGGTRAVVSYGRELYVVELPRGEAGLRIVPRLRPRALQPGDDALRAQLEARGAEGVSFELAYRVEGLSVSSEGEVTLDPGKVWGDAVQRVANRTASKRYDQRLPEWWRRDQQGDWEDVFAPLFGVDPDGRFPLVVPVVVRAKSDDGQQALLWGNLAVLGPWEEMQAALAGEGADASALPPPDPTPAAVRVLPGRVPDVRQGGQPYASPPPGERDERPINWARLAKGLLALAAFLLGFLGWLYRTFTKPDQPPPPPRRKRRRPIVVAKEEEPEEEDESLVEFQPVSESSLVDLAGAEVDPEGETVELPEPAAETVAAAEVSEDEVEAAEVPRPRRRRKKGVAPRRPKRRVGDLALQAAERSAHTASNALLAVAILLTIGAALLAYQRAPWGQERLYAILRLVQFGLVAIFWVLFAAARKRPERAYQPAILGLVLYTPLVGLNVLLNPAALLSPGTVIVVLVLVGLATGVRSSLRYRDYLRQRELNA